MRMAFGKGLFFYLSVILICPCTAVTSGVLIGMDMGLFDGFEPRSFPVRAVAGL